MNVNGVNFVQTGDPQADLVTYAAARGISEAEAKTELQAVFGDPQVPGVNAKSQDEEATVVSEAATTSSTSSTETTTAKNTSNSANYEAFKNLSQTFGIALTNDYDTDKANLLDRVGDFMSTYYGSWENAETRKNVCATLGVPFQYDSEAAHITAQERVWAIQAAVDAIVAEEL